MRCRVLSASCGADIALGTRNAAPHEAPGTQHSAQTPALQLESPRMIRLLVTGGTFDKEYDEIGGTLFFKDTHVHEMLRLGRSRLDVGVETVLLIDSLQMTADDREHVADRCRDCAETQIVVTHGTDTMVETAAVLAERVPGKTIVLTGAMIPYAFGSSDGLFNLGSALSFVQVLPPGVYIAMNGTHFLWNQVRKNRQGGYFEEVGTRE